MKAKKRKKRLERRIKRWETLKYKDSSKSGNPAFHKPGSLNK